MAGQMPEALKKHFEAKEKGKEEGKDGSKRKAAVEKARKMKAMRAKKEAKWLSA